jgi:hypothetical protein
VLVQDGTAHDRCPRRQIMLHTANFKIHTAYYILHNAYCIHTTCIVDTGYIQGLCSFHCTVYNVHIATLHAPYIPTAHICQKPALFSNICTCVYLMHTAQYAMHCTP